MDANKKLVLSLTKKDFKLETFCCPGHGGQNVNKRHTGVRITHIESGATSECCDEREQWQNRKRAFARIVKNPKFKIWINRKLYEIDNQETIEDTVDREMGESNIITETVSEDGKWVKINNLSELL